MADETAPWDPATYPTTIRDEIADYDTLQEQLVAATAGMSPRLILELGTGAGETARRVLALHPDARLIGLDSSEEMLRAAAGVLPADRVELVLRDLKDPLPEGGFDLVISALAVHHLEGELKARLFERVAARLSPGGVFVLADVIVPEDPADVTIEIEDGYDFPSRVDEQLRWMTGAGFVPEIAWVRKDLVVIKARIHAV